MEVLRLVRIGLPCLWLCVSVAQASERIPASADSTLSLATPESRGISGRLLRRLDSRLERSIPSIASFLVWRGGALIHEGYFHGSSREAVFDVKSVTKSVLSAIAGVARSDGYLRNLDTPVIAVLPEYFFRRHGTPDVVDFEELREADSCRARLTLRHLLTMQAGIDIRDNSPVSGAAGFSSDPVRFTLELPFRDDPGDTFRYSTAVAHVFGAALARLVGGDLRAFADSALLLPAHMTLHRWDVDATGRYQGGSEMYFTAQDLLRFGLMYLENGAVGSHQIIPRSWVQESVAEHAALRNWDVMPGVNGYGYYWWRRRSHGHQLFCAIGYGGQIVCVAPDLDMVIVTTCTLGRNNRGRSELPRLHHIIDKLIQSARGL